MVYVVICIACHALVSREARDALKGGRGVVAALIALAVFSPNVWWNAEHGFPTVRHTEANIGWKYPYIHLGKLLQYIGVQFGVFGPILFVVLLRAAWREIRHPSNQSNILLLSFSLPVLALLAIQALVSRAHGNWTATAYPAATILVTAAMFGLNRLILFQISLAIHLVVAAALAVAPAFARQSTFFEQTKPFSRVIGWHEAADAVRAELARNRYGALLVETREMAGELLYYLRDVSMPLYVWPSGPVPMDHYEMTRPFTAGAPEPILYVSLKRCSPQIGKHFASFHHLGMKRIMLVRAKWRMLHFCSLAEYRGPPAPNAQTH